VTAWLDRLDHDDEARLAAAWAAAVLLVVAPAAGTSPDGLEMLALGRSWLGGAATLDPAFWPPLWPLLVSPLSLAADPLAWARLLNIGLAAAVALPLFHLSRLLSGRGPARLAVVAWILLPAVREHAAVLDARPLGWLLAIGATAAVARATSEGRSWGWAFAAAALAPLARPEGLAIPVLVALAWLVSARRAPAAAGALVAMLLPAGAWKLLGPPSQSWSALAEAWYSTWTLTELMTLYGPASLPTGYRAFVLDLVASGAESVDRNPLLMLRASPASLAWAGLGLHGALGTVGLLAAGAGVVRVALRSSWHAVSVLLVFAPLAAVALVPASTGQSTAAANVLFAVPLLLVGLTALPARAAAAAIAVAVIEVHLSPARPAPPGFHEGSQTSRTAQAWLEAHPGDSGVVYGGLEVRGLTQAAGLEHAPLPTAWEPFAPRPGSRVLVSSVSLGGADGGRALGLLEDPSWEVAFVTREGAERAWRVDRQEVDAPYWIAVLRPRG